MFATATAKGAHSNMSAAERAACEKACSAAKSTNATAAVAKGAHGVDAVVAGAQCKSNSVKASKYAHSDCESCSDWSVCEGELAKAESQMQVIPLKNGVMYVFTSTDPNNAGRVQSVLSSRNNRVKALMEAGDQATLCGQCKAFRGAIASGNLTREVVNIEGGSLMIMTSPDRQMVNQLYSLAGLEGQELIEG